MWDAPIEENDLDVAVICPRVHDVCRKAQHQQTTTPLTLIGANLMLERMNMVHLVAFCPV